MLFALGTECEQSHSEHRPGIAAGLGEELEPL